MRLFKGLGFHSIAFNEIGHHLIDFVYRILFELTRRDGELLADS
jgi:hypothetical protein